MMDFGLGWSGLAHGILYQAPPVLAQVNLGGSPATFLGIVLACSGVALYLLRNFRPQLARDSDIAFAAIALLVGAILFFQGWRLDPLLTFGYYLLAVATGYFAYQNIRLRGVTTEQAKRFSPMVDDERPVSKVYRAELDDTPPRDDYPSSRRIRGNRSERPIEADYYEDGSRRRPTRSLSDRSSSRSRRRPSEPDSYDASSYYGSDEHGTSSPDWGEDYGDDTASRSSTRRRDRASDRIRRPRPGSSSRRSSRSAADYVDYQPVDYADDYRRSEW
jgi:hypothetical protein